MRDRVAVGNNHSRNIHSILHMAHDTNTDPSSYLDLLVYMHEQRTQLAVLRTYYVPFARYPYLCTAWVDDCHSNTSFKN